MVFIDEKTDGFVYKPCKYFVLHLGSYSRDNRLFTTASLAKSIYQTGSQENETLWLMESIYTLFESGFTMYH